MARQHRMLAFTFSILMFSSIIPLSHTNETELKNSVVSNVEPYSENWLLNGTFYQTGMTGVDSNLSSWMYDSKVIIPYLNLIDTSNFLFTDNFNDQYGGTPNGWNCGSVGVSEDQGYARFSAGSGGTDNAYCHIDINHLNFNQSNQVSFYFKTWQKSGYEHFFRGTKIYGVFNDERNFFMFLEDENKNLIITTNYQDSNGTWFVEYCQNGTTQIPQPTLQQDFHEWLIHSDNSKEKFWLYQDGIKRCNFNYLPVKNNGAGLMMEIGASGSDSDYSEVEYDVVGATPGLVPFHQGGSWVSPPLVKNMDHQWGSLDLDWQWWGIGNFQDVRDSVRLTIRDQRDNSTIPGFSQMSPTPYPLNLSSIPHSTPIYLEVEWLVNVTSDLVGLTQINYSEGEPRPPDLEVVGFSVDIYSDHIIFLYEIIIHRLNGSNYSIPIRLFYNDNIVINYEAKVMIWSPHQTYSSTLMRPKLGVGEYNSTFALDWEQELSEENEQNNVISKSFIIVPTTIPEIKLINEPKAGEAAIFELAPTSEGMVFDNFSINWNDASENYSNIYEPQIPHIYLSSGLHFLNLTVYFSGIAVEGALFFRIENLPPIANITISQPWDELPQVLRMTCENSIDSLGDELTCEWFLTGGENESGENVWLSGETITHDFSSLGLKFITLRVTDLEGLTDEITTNFTIVALPTMRILNGVELNSSTIREGVREILVRPIWNNSIDEVDKKNLSLSLITNSQEISIGSNISDWQVFPTEIRSGVYSGSILAIMNSSNGIEYDIVNFYYTVINNPPIFKIEYILPEIIYEDDFIVFNFSKSFDDPWDKLSLTAETSNLSTIIYSINYMVYISFPDNGNHTITFSLSDGDDFVLDEVIVEVANKIPTMKPSCWSNTDDKKITINCRTISKNDSYSDLESLSIIWDTPWGNKEGDNFTFHTDDPGEPTDDDNLYGIGYEIIDDDGARTSGFAYVMIEPLLSQEENSKFIEEDLVFPVSIISSIFLVILIFIAYVGNRGKKPIGERDWFKKNPWADQTEIVVEETDSWSGKIEP